MSAAVSRPDRFAPWLVRLHDLGLTAAATWGALAIRYRFEDHPPPPDLFAQATVTLTLVSAAIYQLFRLHAGLWRFSTLNDAWRVFRAVLTAQLVFLPVLFAVERLEGFPRSTPFVLVPLITALLCFGRWAAHALAQRDLRAGFRLENRSLPAALVVGSTASVRDLLRVRAPRSFRISGVVTLDGAPPGRTIAGAEVLGPLDRLRDLVDAMTARDGRPPQILLAEARASRETMDAVLKVAGRTGATLIRSRALNGGPATLAPIQAADLLDRPSRGIDPARAGALIRGKRVLVTGAGGTIGSELTRQAAALGPERLILADASEFNLYAIDEELRDTRCPIPWTPELADVRDEARMRQLFAATRPDVVLHAAALKHVPLMETHPAEAVLTNVAGALTVARLARDACEAFVFISTDKAVNPTNVMGATKRVGERGVQAVAAGGRARVAAVRFGNVLGSTGSVVPLFERQIAHSGPVTVTHPDMVRYFMTVQEAASLVLAAGALPEEPGAGGVFVLDMGEPVRIDDLARQLIRLHGLRPEHDIPITYTGLRPGEKLSEEIFYAAETVRPTAVDGVLRAMDEAPAWAELEDGLGRLIAAAVARDEPAVLAALSELEPAFKRG